MFRHARSSINNCNAQRQPGNRSMHGKAQENAQRGNVIPFPVATPVQTVPVDVFAPGEDGSHQPGKGPVTVFVSAVALFATLGFLGHVAGLL